jgi:thioredoxin-related protein
MKRIILTLIVVFSSVLLSAQGIEFQHLTLEQTIAKAKAENKYVFIDVYTDWCGPCKLMSAQVFPMKEMGDYFNPKFVSLKLNGETTVDGKSLVSKYKITAYPTFIILDGDGNMIHLFAGGVIGLAFIDKVAESFNPDKAMGNLQKLYDSGDRSKKTMSSYLKALINSYTVDYRPMLDKFVDSLKPEELICNECLFIFDDLARLDSPRTDFYIKNLDKFRASVGREKADTLLKKKFEAYYAGLLGNQRPKNEVEFEAVNKKLDSLNLHKTDILSAYKTTVKAVITKSGADDIVKAAKKAVGKVHSNETDVFLYYAIPASFSILSNEQVDQLMALVKNENVRPKLESTIKRMREKPANK